MNQARAILTVTIRLGLLGVVGLTPMFACSSGPKGSGDPLVDVRGEGLSEETRLAAVDKAWEQANDGTLERQRVRDEFKKDVFLMSTGDAVRLRMVEKLLSDTGEGAESDTMNFLRLRLPTERAWGIVELTCKESADRGWVAMTPSLVRSYARQVPDPIDEQRPERAALLKLHPGKQIEEIVYDVFIGAATKPVAAGAKPVEPKATPAGAKEPLPMGTGRSGRSLLEEKIQSDAWELLVRLDKDGSRRAALLSQDSRVTGGAEQDPILADLRAAAKDLRAVPVTGPELEWVRSLRAPGNADNAAWWAAANRQQWMTMSRDMLRGELTGRLNQRKTYSRGADRNDVMESPPETIPAWDPKLSWGDLLTILVLDDALADARVRSEVFAQAKEDRANRQTEYGGALEAVWPGRDPKKASPTDGSGGTFEARLYLPAVPPRVVMSGGDTRFVASEQMIASTPRCLAHYHFHVQNDHNEDYAGPSSGDLDYAASYARNCLVFTSIKSGVLNADYYQRNGARIDLGELRP